MGISEWHLLLLPLTAILAVLYFVPSFIAYKRNHKNKLPIFVLNLLLGWSGIVWIGVLIWALLSDHGSGIGPEKT